jgi:protein-S-isoprenylcysteine O-methyltransferase Ste14
MHPPHIALAGRRSHSTGRDRDQDPNDEARKAINAGTAVPSGEAVIANLLPIYVFAIEHNVVARRQFKRWWRQLRPTSVERGIYLLFASVALILLFRQWHSIPTVIWHVELLAGAAIASLVAISAPTRRGLKPGL